MNKSENWALELVSSDGQVALTCGLPRSVNGQIELSVDAAEPPPCLVVQVFDPARVIICERIVRSVPMPMSFRPVATGQYRVVARPLRSTARREDYSWTQTERKLFGLGEDNDKGWWGEAVLEVA